MQRPLSRLVGVVHPHVEYRGDEEEEGLLSARVARCPRDTINIVV